MVVGAMEGSLTNRATHSSANGATNGTQKVTLQNTRGPKADSLTAGAWYRHCLEAKPPMGGWFGLWDCFFRCSLRPTRAKDELAG